jgi:hypothetical protein
MTPVRQERSFTDERRIADFGPKAIVRYPCTPMKAMVGNLPPLTSD